MRRLPLQRRCSGSRIRTIQTGELTSDTVITPGGRTLAYTEGGVVRLGDCGR
jgi:hypothetical protein